jgi:hypothetical protein
MKSWDVGLPVNDLDVDAQGRAVLDHGVLEAGIDPALGDAGVGLLGLVEEPYSQGVLGQARGGDGDGEDEPDGGSSKLTGDPLSSGPPGGCAA